MPKSQSVAMKSKAKKGLKKKRAVDPFLKKQWYVVKVPKYVNPHSGDAEHGGTSWRVGYTPANKGKAKKSLDNRSFVVNLGDLQNEAATQSFEDLNWKKFKFITEDTYNNLVLTQWYGMEITRDKRCSLIRKWHSMIECFCDAKTTDGYVLRVKALAFTKRQSTQIKKSCYAKTSQKRVIRAKMRDIIGKEVSACDLKQVVEKLSNGSIGKTLRNSCQLTFPLKVCLVEKVKVMRKPRKDVAKLMNIHDLKVAYDPLTEVEKEDMDEDGAGDVQEEAAAEDAQE